METERICQCCGMPLDDEALFSREPDGTRRSCGLLRHLLRAGKRGGQSTVRLARFFGTQRARLYGEGDEISAVLEL